MIGDGGEVPTPMSDLAGVVGEALSSLVQNWLEWGSGRMAMVIWQCHHDQGVDLEGGRRYPL